MLGGRHIETAAWKAPGKWLDSSGWTAALVQDDIATPGKADSFLKACIQNKTCTPGHSCSILHSVAKGLLIIIMLKNIMMLLIILTSGDN